MESLAAEGETVPALARRPPLTGLRTYWRAFNDLMSSRAYSMGGPGPIAWEAIDRWAQRHGIIDLDEFEELVAAIRALDAVWLDEQAKLAEKRAKNS
jgi:hypothetical protein